MAERIRLGRAITPSRRVAPWRRQGREGRLQALGGAARCPASCLPHTCQWPSPQAGRASGTTHEVVYLSSPPSSTLSRPLPLPRLCPPGQPGFDALTLKGAVPGCPLAPGAQKARGKEDPGRVTGQQQQPARGWGGHVICTPCLPTPSRPCVERMIPGSDLP